MSPWLPKPLVPQQQAAAAGCCASVPVGEEAGCCTPERRSLSRTRMTAYQECLACISFWKPQTCCTSNVVVIWVTARLKHTNLQAPCWAWVRLLSRTKLLLQRIFSWTDNEERAHTMGNCCLIIHLLFRSHYAQCGGKGGGVPNCLQMCFISPAILQNVKTGYYEKHIWGLSCLSFQQLTVCFYCLPSFHL